MLLVFILIVACQTTRVRKTQIPADALVYTINLNKRADDLFHVRLNPGLLNQENNIYQFASTAPGTYQVMDIGRYVRSFRAYDARGNALPVKHISTNQWKLSDTGKVREIRYTIAETWDTPVDSNHVYSMCGTSIERDHVFINGQAVFGYPKGLQKKPVLIKYTYPEEWLLGTALQKKDGFYFAKDYDQLVDSPVLMGTLTSDSLNIRGAKVRLFTYSETGMIQSGQILSSIKDILNAAADFTNGLPVDHYTFLFHFEKNRFGGGAWEHSYSSDYTMPEDSLSTLIKHGFRSTIAHEFFHIITPLNIHTEIVENFNFVKPVASRHLWLYEGTTEWAARIMQLRDGLVPLKDYFNTLSKKLRRNEHYKANYSLVQLSLNSYSVAGQRQYGNIYAKGALTAGLLDIRLLELSHGTRGLREVINDLAKKFGPHHAFADSAFFDIFVKETYPEINDFITRYIKGAQPLPIADYFGKIGIDYLPEQQTGKLEPSLGMQVRMTAGGDLTVVKVDSLHKRQGIDKGDTVMACNGLDANAGNLRTIFSALKTLPADSSFTLSVKRNDGIHTLSLHKVLKNKVEHYVFKVNTNPTDEQKRLRAAWLKNLPTE